MSTPGDFAQNLKQRADIVRIVGEYVKLRRSGAQNFQGLCPFHSEKTPSFSVHATRQFFHCFGCGASGDVFSFLQKVENITFPEAVRLLAEKLGVPLPKMQYSSETEAREARQRGALIEIHECACAWFQQQLQKPEAAHAREYLASRGLTPEIISEFRIGYAPETGFLLRDALRGQFDESVLRDSGLFSWKEQESPEQKPLSLYSKFRNRVMFPIANEMGKVIAFTGRTLAADEKSGPKYLNSPETPIYTKSRVLFNLDKAKEAIRKLGYAILVEGQMDCISVYTGGFHNVIASSGTAFTELQVRLLARFSKNIVVNFDPDTAGAAAAERSLAMLVEEDFQIKVLTLEAGFDPDLFIRRKGSAAYAKVLGQSQKYFDYLIERAQKQFGTRSPEAKVKAVNFLLPHVQRIPNRIVRDELALEIAYRLDIDSSVLRQELRRAAIARTTSQLKPAAASPLTDAERVLIRALASSGLAGGEDTGREGSDQNFDPARQAHFVLTQESIYKGLGTERLIEALLMAVEQSADPMSLPLEEADRRLLAGVLMNESEELTPELVEGAVHSLRRRHLKKRMDELQHQLRDAERRQDANLAAQLLSERLRLRREMGEWA